MSEIARLGGRFITVLPANRKENAAFRKQLMQPSSRSASNGSRQNADDSQPIEWQEILRLIDEFTNEDGEIVEKVRDVFQVCTPERISKEGYRLLWFHSLGKATNDAETRARHIERAERELEDLRRRVEGPRTRFRSKEKIESAAKEIVEARGVQDFLSIHIEESEHEEFHQTTRGRPTKNTKYKRTVVKRFRLTWQLDAEQIEAARAGDGVFPLITNIRDWSAEEILEAYKRQPTIEKRVSQLKSDYRVAPVYLKSVHRIVGLLAVYFFALMVQSLIERELRNAMTREDLLSLPLYPEGRACLQPTTRQVIDVFELAQRHTLHTPGEEIGKTFPTKLADVHEQILKLLKVPKESYYQV